MKDNINIYIAGMGGQGVAFLARLLSEALIKSGYKILGCDTHGMSQRGGSVVSHLRTGEGVFTPIIPEGRADIILGLEHLETLRAMYKMGQSGSTVMFYDAVIHPTSVRVNKASYPQDDEIRNFSNKKNMFIKRIHHADLADHKMQNTALLGALVAEKWIPRLEPNHIISVMDEILPEYIKKKNISLFKQSRLLVT